MAWSAVDLFCGCGGLSLGLMEAGIEVVAGFDLWGPALAVHRANLPHPTVSMDLSDVDAAVAAIRPMRPDLIAGGPPCTDFSTAGKRVEGERADLTRSFAKTVAGVRPKAFLMENVAAALKSNAYADARSIMKDAGYGLTERVLNASRCGIPQARKRLFCVGLLGVGDGFMEDAINAALSTKPMTIREALGDLGAEFYYRHPRNYLRRSVFSVDEPSPTIRGVNRPVPPGYPDNPLDPVPARTVSALPFDVRAAIQTFPEDFDWSPAGSMTARERMVGNAVPVRLARFVAERLLESAGTLRAAA